jgi:hypothetical protein
MEIACSELIAQNPAQDSTLLRFLRTSATATTCFHVKKFLNEGLDLMSWLRGEKK